MDASDEAMFGGATLAAIWERNAIYATDPLCIFRRLRTLQCILWQRPRVRHRLA